MALGCIMIGGIGRGWRELGWVGRKGGGLEETEASQVNAEFTA